MIYSDYNLVRKCYHILDNANIISHDVFTRYFPGSLNRAVLPSGLKMEIKWTRIQIDHRTDNFEYIIKQIYYDKK